MTSPRVEIDLSKIRHNTRSLVRRLRARGISVTGVTKAVCGDPAIAQAMLDGGVINLAEARISNVDRLRRGGITEEITMIRTPMLSQVERIVMACPTSYNTEISVINALATAARKYKKTHNIILMVEMGDMREGILPENLNTTVQHVLNMPGVALKGIGANFACLKGQRPQDATLARLSLLVTQIESACGRCFATVSGGNSANLPWAFGPRAKGRINNLRLGESILLGVDPITGAQISGLYTDAFSLVAEVIETTLKPDPTPFSNNFPNLAMVRLVPQINPPARSILALGQQDTDMAGLTMPAGITCLGSTSDHLVVHKSAAPLRVGNELRFGMNYNALMRAMSAPDITKSLHRELPLVQTRTGLRGAELLRPLPN